MERCAERDNECFEKARSVMMNLLNGFIATNQVIVTGGNHFFLSAQALDLSRYPSGGGTE